MGILDRLRPSVENLALYNVVSVLSGGALAAYLINPELDSGPVRVGTFLLFFIASVLLSVKYVRIVRSSGDGMSNVFLVASAYVWILLSGAFLFVTYIQIARAFGFYTGFSSGSELRISYFFISGAAVGALFKAFVFAYLPRKVLMGKRIRAWPLTVGQPPRKRRRKL